MKTYREYLNETLDPNKMSEEEKIKYVKQTGHSIVYIDNPSEKVQLASIETNPWLIHRIDNPSEEMQLAAVKVNELAVRSIKNPTEKVKQYVANNMDFNELINWPIDYVNNIQEKIKDYITKEQYYKVPKDFPWIPEIKEKFKDIDRFKRFNL